MNRITIARRRLAAAAGLPGVLDAAYDAFEGILAVLRYHQERAGHAFPAFVLAAGAAATGRDWVAEAPSLPAEAAPQPNPPPAGDLLAGHPWPHVAAEVAALSEILAAVLGAAATAAAAARPGDRASCQQAAGYAARISMLLAGARQP